MLWTLLTAMTSVAFFATAVATAKHAKAGLGGYAVAIIIGSLLAIGNAWGMYKVADIIAGLPISYSETREEWLGRAIFLLVLLLSTGQKMNRNPLYEIKLPAPMTTHRGCGA
jgi:di/tricarboxylate transporter